MRLSQVAQQIYINIYWDTVGNNHTQENTNIMKDFSLSDTQLGCHYSSIAFGIVTELCPGFWATKNCIGCSGGDEAGNCDNPIKLGPSDQW